ncbi:MFS transporter [Streptomyces sp. NPDC093984]|uniref:MFS transporter n=1 Tax=Streptomyces sp. NPDC093984 TaxID=3366052 RepID=UPI003828E659
MPAADGRSWPSCSAPASSCPARSPPTSRRRTSATTLLCGLAPDTTTLIAARPLQGIGGALLPPGSLAIIEASLHPDDRPRAIGLWPGFGGIGAAIGPFPGGRLADGPGWRWTFLLTIPPALVCVPVELRHVPESEVLGAGGRRGAAGLASGIDKAAARAAGLVSVAALPLVVGMGPDSYPRADRVRNGVQPCHAAARGAARHRRVRGLRHATSDRRRPSSAAGPGARPADGAVASVSLRPSSSR